MTSVTDIIKTTNNNLVSECSDIAQTVLVGRELGHMTYEHLDHFDVCLAECNHDTRHVSVVLTVNVSTVGD